MGRVSLFITILIFIDLLFLATGQICSTETCTLSSIIFDAIINLKDGVNLNLFTQLMGNFANFTSSTTGILSLIAGVVGVTVGSRLTNSDTILFIPMAIALSVLSSDFIVIFVYLSSFNLLLALFVIAPLVITYYIVILDWLRGKD